MMNEELINTILELLNPLDIDSRYKVLEDLKISLDAIDGNDL